SHERWTRALIFSSNSGCVTSSREKSALDCIDCLRGSVCTWRYRPDRCEPVCAIARDTSEDSAGIKSTTGDNVGDSQHERDPVGRTRTERHYHSAHLPGNPGPFLEARTFRLRVRFLSLFSGRLVIKDVSLVNPNIVWAQNAEGKWKLPGARKKEAPAVSPNPPLKILQSRAPREPVEPATPPAVAVTPARPPSPPQVTVDQ